MNFATLLFDAAVTHAERPAISADGVSVTYAELAARASAFAEAFQGNGTRPGDRVGILLPHGADAAAAYFGACAVGAVGVNINWLLRPRQVEFILSQCDAQALVTTDAWEALQPRKLATRARAVRVEDVAARGTLVPITVDAHSPAQITYTSGSTGQPRGVVTSHANLWAGVGPVVRYLGLEAHDRIASLLPFSYVYGFSQLTCALAVGARLDVIGATMPSDVVASLVELQTTVVAGVPPVWQQLLGTSRFRAPIPALRVLTCAGGRLAPDLVRAVRSAQPQAQLFLMYGFTEVFRSAYLSPNEVDEHPDSIGRAVEGSQIHVLREDGTECAPGEIGELVHAGPTVALGYWNDPEATAATFVPAPAAAGQGLRAARSGDLVRRDDAGRLFFVGRRDQMIKTLGVRVSPDEVSDVLRASGQVAEVVVTSEPDERRGQRIVAHVVLAPGGTLEALRHFAGTELPRHMQPARWETRDRLPRLPNGKYEVRALRHDASAAPRPD